MYFFEQKTAQMTLIIKYNLSTNLHYHKKMKLFETKRTRFTSL